MKRSSFSGSIFSIVTIFLILNSMSSLYAIILNIPDPQVGQSLWSVATRIFSYVKNNCEGIDSITSKTSSTDSKVCKIDSKVCSIDSKIGVIDSKIDALDSLHVKTKRSRLHQSSTAISDSTTIFAPGVYYLKDDVQGTITIHADNVTLDLDNHAIMDANNGIVINSNCKDIVIKNGSIGGGNSPTQLGISVSSGCSRITIEDMTIVDCDLDAINFSGTSSSPIKSIEVRECRLENSNCGLQTDNVQGGFISQCSLSSNITGLSCDESERIVIDNCFAFANERTGFELKQSNNNCIKNCKAIKNGSTGSENAYGFVSNAGSCNVFEDCVAISTTTNSTSSSKVAAGFAFISTETRSLITRCTSKKTTAPATKGSSLDSSESKSYGIYIEGNATQCVVKDNLVMGTTGGIGGVGYKADGSKNLIIKNIGYENDINYDELIINAYKTDSDSYQNGLENLSFPSL